MKNILVCGAGQMGTGIAQVCLENGYHVALFDQSEEQLHRAKEILQRKAPEYFNHLTLTHSPDFTHADLIIEAIAENLAIKKVFWRAVTPGPHTILATNTSSYSITEMASWLHESTYAENFMGIHFMNPVPKMNIVEVISGLMSFEKTQEKALDFVHSLKKTPVLVKDRPGFVVNRLLIPMLNEAIFLLDQNVATKEDIDIAMKGAAGHPMGPLALADLIGLDTCLAILKDLHTRLGEDKYRPCPLLENYVHAGYLGRKSGRGFYAYGTA